MSEKDNALELKFLVQVVCADCKKSLFLTAVDMKEHLCIETKPCPTCMERAYNEGMLDTTVSQWAEDDEREQQELFYGKEEKESEE